MAMAPNDLNAQTWPWTSQQKVVADHSRSPPWGVATLRRPGQRLRRFFRRSASCLKKSNATGPKDVGFEMGPKSGATHG